MAKTTRRRSLGTATDSQRLRIDVQQLGGFWNVFLTLGGRRQRVGGPLSVALVEEARKYGQDPVEDLVEEAMLLADRRSGPAGPARR